MKNKKGFTLAELLGVIVILLLLVLIVTPIFINYSKKASKSAYEVQINTIKESAREWALDEENIKLLPTKENECVEITLEKLKEIGLLDYNITNPKTKAKFSDESTVIIRKVGKELTYTYNENGEETCDTVITTDYPRWVFISSTPSVAGDTDEVTVNIKSDRKISEESLDPEDITVKVGGKIIDDAVVTVSCSGIDPLTCELKISNLDGDGKLSLVIDKDTMKDEDLNPSRITNIQTNTTIDTSGPKITYTGKTNTNSSIYYATKDDTVVIRFKAEDNGSVVNELTAEDIIVYLDGVPVDCGKSLTTTGSGTKVNYELSLTNVTGNGKLSIKIPTGKIKDNRGNLNNEKIISPGITYDNQLPIITYTPNGTVGYVRNINVRINAKDEETGIDEDTLKYIFTTDINATPNVAIANGGKISKDSVTGDYYIIGYVCDYAGNCVKVPSNIYQMNNSAPEIVINPDGNSGYTKSATINIKVTSHGEALDEGSLKYIISDNPNDTPSKNFTNNQNITIDNLSGVYYVIAEACDVTGLCTIKTSQEFYFDNEAPTVTYTPNGTYTNGAYYWTKKEDVTINVTDNVSVDWAKYKMSTSKTATPDVDIENGEATKNVTATDATKTLYLITKACDNLGNCKTSVSNKYQIDKTKPVIESISVSGRYTTIHVTDDIKLSKYEIINSSNSKYTVYISGTDVSDIYENTASGTYTFKLYDHVGNVSETTFTIPSYKVTFASADSTKGTVSPSEVEVNYAGTATATATPASGYKVVSVSGTGCSLSGNTITAGNVTSARTCTVTFGVVCEYSPGESWEYTTQGTITEWVAPCEGIYELESCGAKGGVPSYNSGGSGGKGGYAKGRIELAKGTKLYVAVGGNGTSTGGGYNGGANGRTEDNSNGHNMYGGGGGASHIGTFNATLASHNSDTGLYVVGGGGGGVVAYRRWNDSGDNVSSDRNGGAGGDSSTASSTKWTGTYEGGGGGYYGGTRYNGGTNYTSSSLSFTSSNKGVCDGPYGHINLISTSDDTTTVWNYPYTSMETPYVFVAPRAGTYKLEVWGAQGGSANGDVGGAGGYSSGTVTLSKNDVIYVVVGGRGQNASVYYNVNRQNDLAGGYNGGGLGRNNCVNDNTNIGSDGYETGGGSGGGATHMGTFNSTLEAHGSTSGLYLVAGGGGGRVATMGAGSTIQCAAGYGGGTSGGDGSINKFNQKGDPLADDYSLRGTGGGQTGDNKHSFGKGAKYSGGGLYGGSAASGSSWWRGGTIKEGGHGVGHCGGGAGGSGYIGGVSNGVIKAGNETFTSPGGANETGHTGDGYGRITFIS